MRLRCLYVAAALVGAALLGGAAARSPIVAFNRIEPGSWQLRALEGSAPVPRMCIHDARDLIQLRHPGAICSRFVLTNDAQTATIHYTCTGAGYGRTTIKVETGQLIRVESQGLLNRAPFADTYEGRRVGSCGPTQAPR
jgi:hypothetical protein